MSILDDLLDSVDDAVILDDDTYEVSIETMYLFKVSSGDLQLAVLALPVGHDEADPIFYSMWLPKEADKPHQQRAAARKIKKFCQSCGIDMGDFKEAMADAKQTELKSTAPWTDFINKTGEAVVGSEEWDGETRNRIIKFI